VAHEDDDTPEEETGDDGLAPRHHRAIAALLTFSSIEKAARHVGHSDKTLRDWLKRPEFRAAYKRAADEALTEATVQLRAAAPEAVKFLRETLADKNNTHAVRERAASKLLEYAYVRIAGRVEEDDDADGFDGIDFVVVRRPSQTRELEAAKHAGES
jgi:transposase